MTPENQCNASGPNGLKCTRHGTDHDTHTTYVEVNEQLRHVEWWACNPIGEPVEDGETDAQ